MSEEKLEPEIRFEGFGDKWEEVNLGDNSKIIAGGTPSTKIDAYWRPKEIPWLSSGEVHKKRIYYTNDYISIEGLDNSSARWIKKHSVLIALAGQGKTRGTVAINEIPMTTNQSIAAIEPNEKIYYEFLFSNLEKRYEELRLMSAGDGSRGGLNKKLISEVNINLPQKFKEQKLIGKFLLSIDQSIEQKDNDLKKIKQFKQAMLQKMFPKEGERVPEVRFEGFEGEWEFKELGDVTSVNTGDSDLQDSVSDGKYPLFVRSDEVRRSNRYLFDGEAILIPGEGRLGEIFHYVNGKFDFHQRVYKISDFIGVDAKYIMYYMKRYFKRHALKNTAKATVDSLRRDVITKFEIQIPSINEQKRISNYFNTLEQNIQSKQSELDKLKQFKQAMLDKMFV